MYNPEWERFINADGLIGQAGELLAHNLFMYCKNNPVLLKDESGFRPMVATNWDDEIAISRGLPIQADVGSASVVPTVSVSNSIGAALGSALGYIENKTKTIVGYTDKYSVIHMFPKTSIPQTIKPFEKVAKGAAKYVTLITGAFDIANTWDSSSKLTFNQKLGKSVLQAIGIGAAFTVGALLSGPVLAAGITYGTAGSIIGGLLGAAAIDFGAGAFIGAVQNYAYKKSGWE